jgi:hypothetical protein
MSFIELLDRHRPEILGDWFDAIAASYPPDAATFFRNERNRFANPVGHAFVEGTGVLFEALLRGEFGNAREPLEFMIRIRAVQSSSPGEALAFVFALKDVVRRRFAAAIRQQDLYEELLAFESRVDRLALCAFDLFMSARERIHEIRANAVKRQFAKAPGAREQASCPEPGTGTENT